MKLKADVPRKWWTCLPPVQVVALVEIFLSVKWVPPGRQERLAGMVRSLPDSRS